MFVVKKKSAKTLPVPGWQYPPMEQKKSYSAYSRHNFYNIAHTDSPLDPSEDMGAGECV
jgi:hypothetical protein